MTNETNKNALRQAIKHSIEQPFILTTGLAALAHSTWTLGTLFTGDEPIPFTLDWLWWVIPAFLIAFALDVGQIATSADIRNNGGTIGKYTTFGVFAIATYYLQWVYMMHHIPAVALGAGIRSEWIPFVELFRDVAIFAIPALLPLATLLYTFSSSESKTESKIPLHTPHSDITIETPDLSEKIGQTDHNTPLQLPPTVNGIMSVMESIHIATCDTCNWHKVYETETSAKRGLSSHKQHCAVSIGVDLVEND